MRLSLPPKGDASGEANAAKGELADLDREIERLVNAIAAMGHSDAIATRLQSAEAKRARLVKQQRPAAAAASFKIDDVMARYNRQLLNLEIALASAPEKARAAIRAHFGKRSPSKRPPKTPGPLSRPIHRACC